MIGADLILTITITHTILKDYLLFEVNDRRRPDLEEVNNVIQ